MLKIGLTLAFVAAGLGWWWTSAKGPLRDPEDALRDFYEAKNRPEEQLMDPLILSGRRVVPLVIAAVQDKGMKRRRYAITFLGNGRYERALPVLEAILVDETEVYYYRGDALKAICRIAPERGLALASAYVDGKGILGRVARSIRAGEDFNGETRSYWDALWHG